MMAYGASLDLTASITGINGFTGNVTLGVTEIYAPPCCTNYMTLQLNSEFITANTNRDGSARELHEL